MPSDAIRPFTASLTNDLVGASEIKRQVLKLNDSHTFERMVIGMEATNLYSFHPAMFFHEDSDLKALKVEVMVEHPNKIKKSREAFEENKNDPLDAFYIADYFRIEQLTKTKQHFIENIYYKCNTLSTEIKNENLSTTLWSSTIISLMTEDYSLDELATIPHYLVEATKEAYGRLSVICTTPWKTLIKNA